MPYLTIGTLAVIPSLKLQCPSWVIPPTLQEQQRLNFYSSRDHLHMCTARLESGTLEAMELMNSPTISTPQCRQIKPRGQSAESNLQTFLVIFQNITSSD